MRTIGLIIALSFALSGPSFSTTTTGKLQGAGTFSYNGASNPGRGCRQRGAEEARVLRLIDLHTDSTDHSNTKA